VISYLFEFGGRAFGVFGILVGVVLQCKKSILLFDLIRPSCFLKAKDFIIVSAHGGC